MFVRILALFAAVLFVSCGGSAEVEVVNESRAVVADVLVIAPGATVIVGNLNPGQRRTFSICPSHESSLDVQFVARGKERTVPARTYIECSTAYRVALTIGPDFSVRSAYKIPPAGRR